MYPHRIRLRGPWDCEPLFWADHDTTRNLPPPIEMALPCRWAEGGLYGFAGRVRFRRRFGYPGQLDSSERVWLTCTGVEGTSDWQLNGAQLGHVEDGAPRIEFEVTALLQPRNELVVEVEGPDTGGLWGEVAMEIRRTAFLRAVSIVPFHTGEQLRMRVTGEVVGTSDGLLELYVVVGRSNAAYATVEAAPEGKRFELETEPVGDGESLSVRVELVNGATVWYRVEGNINAAAP
jgi:hypothetical protein